MAPTSTTDDLPTTLIKSDRSGRPRYTQQYKSEVLAAYDASGMSGPAFAEHCGLKYPTFASWVAKQRREKNGKPESEPVQSGSFILAEFGTDAEPGGQLHVELPGGATAKLSSPAQASLLAALIKALA